MKANVAVAAFFVNCPHCDADVSSPTGSLMWNVNETIPETIECDNCEARITLPAKAVKWCE
jgi:transcription elongation factor Elf1